MTSELAGVPEEKVLCIEESADPKRQAIFAFARKVSLKPAEITRADVDSLRPYFNDTQIVELVLAVCRYNTMNRLADAFGVPLEKENVFAPPPKAKEKGKGKAPETTGAAIVSVKGDLVSISAGASDSIRVGDAFWLSRLNALVGKAIVVSVDKDFCVGRFEGDGRWALSPQVGDTAVRAKRD